MKKGGSGGAKTHQSGEEFEGKTALTLLSQLKSAGYSISNEVVSNNKPKVIELSRPDGKKLHIFFKAAIYKYFFLPRKIDYRDFFSLRLEPDTAIFSPNLNVLTIIEKKQQTVSGSVAEKLQTCDFKQKFYETLCNPVDVEVDLVWQLGQYFKDQEDNLKSVFEYLLEKGSRYYFHEIPIEKLRI
jgi:hypothetical protein